MTIHLTYGEIFALFFVFFVKHLLMSQHIEHFHQTNFGKNRNNFSLLFLVSCDPSIQEVMNCLTKTLELWKRWSEHDGRGSWPCQRRQQTGILSRRSPAHPTWAYVVQIHVRPFHVLCHVMCVTLNPFMSKQILSCDFMFFFAISHELLCLSCPNIAFSVKTCQELPCHVIISMACHDFIVHCPVIHCKKG